MRTTQASITPRQLQKAITRLGYNQETFAAYMKVNQGTVSRWVSGKTGIPWWVGAIVKIMLDKEGP